MRDFFHGWRRTMGLAMLAVAVLVVMAWVRSLSVADVLLLPGAVSNSTAQSIWSAPHRLIFLTEVREHDAFPNFAWSTFPTRTSNIEWKNLPVRESPFDGVTQEWSWWALGLGVGIQKEVRVKSPVWESMGMSASYSVDFKLWVVHYLSLVVPLTLLAVWLLFSQPRVPISEARKPSEPQQFPLG